jgi:predicted methyltransferase
MRDEKSSGRVAPSRRAMLAACGWIAAGGLSACGDRETGPPDPETPAGPPEGSLEWAIAGPWRAADRGRDSWRHPLETLRFFGLQPAMTVVDFWPGSGWFTEILAPYLLKGDGTYYAVGFATGPGSDPAQAALNANFEQRFSSDRRLYGEIRFSQFGAMTGPVAPAGTADMVLFMRCIHAWMAAGTAEKAFADAFAALKSRGILGIEQHRLGPDQDQDPAAADGYVQEAFVKQLAAEAGFIFEAASEINANPDDTKDHPFGVETLPPRLLTAPQGSPPDPTFDSAPFVEIGESDRMTLKFRKPE